MATKQKTVKRKTVPLPKNEILVAPLSDKALEMEYMSSVYPIGFGYTEKGNAVVIAHSKDDEDNLIVVEHLITPKQLERIIEIAQEVLGEMGKQALGIKTGGK